MDFRQLRYFATVAELENLTIAAGRLHIAQSALSRQIANLEAELGVKLFHRVGKRLRLAPAGERLRPSVQKLLTDADALKSIALMDAIEVTGEVKIGAHPSDGDVLFPRLMSQVNAQLPSVKLDLIQEMTAAMQEMLLIGRLDVAILTMPDPMPGFHITVLAREPLYFLAPTERCPPGLGEECRIADVLGLPLVLPHKPHRERLAYENAAKHHRVQLQVGAEVEGLPLMKLLAMQGRGFLILPGTALHGERLDPHWKVVRVIDGYLDRYLARRETSVPSRAREAVLFILDQVVGELKREAIFI
jgi:LysR family transcriptional regulator, nitrogen assimilation regulatory protein